MLRSPSALIAFVLFLLALAAPSFAAGVLVPRDGGKPIKVKSQSVTAVVEDGLARTTLRQTFVNPGDASLEAVYLFPVPENAALVDVAMEVGGQRLEGLLVERQKARRIYNEIVRSNKDPALVEQIGRSRFRLSVFPVEPNKPTVVELSWIESVPLAGGDYRYVYPLELAQAKSTWTDEFVLNVTFKSSAPIKALSSTTADAELALVSDHEARMGIELRNIILDQDIVATATVAPPEPSLSVRSYRDEKGAGYFTAVLTPPVAEQRPVPRDVTLVIDTSGSMSNGKLEQAVRSAEVLFDGLRPTDRFNVIRFASVAEPFAPAPVPANAEQLKVARAFVSSFAAKGSTALGDALVHAMSAPVDPERVHLVVLLTDGEPTVGMTAPDELVKAAKSGGAGGRRLFTFGVGADVNDSLLEAMSVAGRGSAEVFRSQAQIEHRMTRFLRRTRSPVLANLTLAVDGLVSFAVHPNPLPDVYLGEQVVFTGRYRDGGRHALRVAGRQGDSAFELEVEADFRTDAGGEPIVRDLHAHQRLTALQRTLRMRSGLSEDAYFAALDEGQYATAGEVVKEVIELSIDSGIQTAFTSFLVLLPEDRARLNPHDLAGLDEARKRLRDKRRADRRSVSNDPKQDPIVKDAKIADHNETDSSVSDTSLRDPRFNSDAPFEGPGTNGTIGIGGGGGAVYGSRGGGGGRRTLRAGGGGKKTETAVDLALEFMKGAQRQDGSWAGGSSAGDLAASGATALTLLGAGETHQSGAYKQNVKQALRYIKSRQTPDGGFGEATTDDDRLACLMASAALTEAYGMTSSRLFHAPAKAAGERLIAEIESDNFRVSDDPYVVLWQMLVLRSYSAALLGASDDTLKSLVRKQHLATRQGADWAALRLLVHALTSDPAGPVSDQVLADRKLLVERGAGPKKGSPDLTPEELHLRTVALYVDGKAWAAWSTGLKSAIVDQQVTDKSAKDRGAWRAASDRGRRLGPVYSTAVPKLVAEVYYRYGRVIVGR